MDADDLIDRNRRLLARAEAARVWKRQVVEEIAETRLMLHVALLRMLHLHHGRMGLLSEMIYLRQLIAHSAALQCRVAEALAEAFPCPPGTSRDLP